MMWRGEAKLSKQTLTLLSITSNRDGAGAGAGAGAGRGGASWQLSVRPI